DHGLTFLPYPRQRTVLVELGGALLPDAVATAVRTLDSDAPRRATLLRHLGRLLAPAEVEAFSGRLRELAADPVYPELDPWDGPPVEWWEGGRTAAEPADILGKGGRAPVAQLDRAPASGAGSGGSSPSRRTR